jgi:putative salt-induced outer membrane protein YdiY
VNKLQRVAIGVLAIVSGGVVVSADVVVLHDGSRIMGNVQTLLDNKLVLETEFAGALEIDVAKIASIEIDEPVNIGMQSGDRLIGPLKWQPDLQQTVVETELGEIPVTVERVDAIWQIDGKSPEALAYEQQLEAVQKELELARPDWSFTVEFGFVMQEGNTDRIDARGNLELARKTDKDLLRFFVGGQYAEDNDVRSTSEVIGGAYYEYLLTERWFAYGRQTFEYDEFEELDLRSITTVGTGYYVIKEDWHELKPRAGISYQHESFFDDTQRDNLQLEIGLDYRLDIAPWLQFTHAGAYYPTFDGLDDYRLEFDTAFLIPLASSDMWRLKFGMKNEYNSMPRPGVDRLDNTYYANILVTLD